MVFSLNPFTGAIFLNIYSIWKQGFPSFLGKTLSATERNQV